MNFTPWISSEHEVKAEQKSNASVAVSAQQTQVPPPPCRQRRRPSRWISSTPEQFVTPSIHHGETRDAWWRRWHEANCGHCTLLPRKLNVEANGHVITSLVLLGQWTSQASRSALTKVAFETRLEQRVSTSQRAPYRPAHLTGHHLHTLCVHGQKMTVAKLVNKFRALTNP
jgi:hypothetical protein